MITPPIPANEDERLYALARYDVLDSPPEESFDALTKLAAELLGVPIALVSIIDAKRQWFKSRYGLEAPETPRELSFCGHVVAINAPLVVPDSLLDERFFDNPLVTGQPVVRSYAGMPLRTKDGFVLGTLCAIDHKPRDFSEKEQEILKTLSDQVIAHLELRSQNQSLRLSQIRTLSYQQFFNLSLDLLCTVDSKFYFLSLNPVWERTLGWTIKELQARPLTELIHSDDLQSTLNEASRLLATGSSVINFRNRYRHKDGRWIPLSWVVAVRDGIFYASARDLSSELFKDELLDLARFRQQESELRLRAVFETMTEGVVLQDLAGKIIECNSSSYEILGLSRDQLLGRKSTDPEWKCIREDGSVYLGDSHPSMVALRTGIHQKDVLMGIYKPNAGLSWITINAKPLFSSVSGSVDGVVVTFHDITSRKRVQDALAANEALLQQLIRHTPAAIAMLDVHMRYLHVSDAWIADYHLQGRDILGKSHYDVFPEIPPRWKEIHSRVLNGAVERCDEDPFPRQGGGTDWLQWEARPWVNSEGNIGGLIFYTQVITERKRAEERLRQSEERFRLAVEFSAIGFAIVDLNGKWMQVNRALCDIVGYSSDELLKLTFQEMTLPADLEEDIMNVKSLLAGTISHYNIQKRYLHKTGRFVWVNLSVALVRGEIKNPLYFVCQIQDISDRKRLEADQNRLISILQETPDYVGMADMEGNLLFHNRAARRMVGLDENADLSGYKIKHVYPEWASKLVLEEGLPKILSGGTWQRETAVLHRNGKEIPVSQVLMLHRDPAGNPETISTIMRDITERKRSEVELNRVAERLRIATEGAEVGIWDWDIISNNLIWDERMYSLYGVESNKFGGAYETWQNSLHPEDAERATRELQDAVKGVNPFNTVFRVRWPDKSVHHIRARAAVVRDGLGNAIKMIGTNWDVTAQILAEVALKASLGEKELLLREIHHRVKNNMQIISSLLNLQASSISDERFSALIEESKARISAMALVHQQLYQTHDLSGVKFRDYAGQLCSSLKQSFMKSDVQIIIQADDSVLSIDDAIPCALITNEWITNAFKYAFPAGRCGKIELGFVRMGNNYILSVTDDGIGLPKGFDPAILTSLGISLVQTLAKQLQGNFYFETIPQTKFIVEFPIYRNGD